MSSSRRSRGRGSNKPSDEIFSPVSKLEQARIDARAAQQKRIEELCGDRVDKQKQINSKRKATGSLLASAIKRKKIVGESLTAAPTSRRKSSRHVINSAEEIEARALQDDDDFVLNAAKEARRLRLAKASAAAGPSAASSRNTPSRPSASRSSRASTSSVKRSTTTTAAPSLFNTIADNSISEAKKFASARKKEREMRKRRQTTGGNSVTESLTPAVKEESTTGFSFSRKSPAASSRRTRRQTIEKSPVFSIKSHEKPTTEERRFRRGSESESEESSVAAASDSPADVLSDDGADSVASSVSVDAENTDARFPSAKSLLIYFIGFIALSVTAYVAYMVMSEQQYCNVPVIANETISAYVNDCKPCPEHGLCSSGVFKGCTEPFTMTEKECSTDAAYYALKKKMVHELEMRVEEAAKASFCNDFLPGWFSKVPDEVTVASPFEEISNSEEWKRNNTRHAVKVLFEDAVKTLVASGLMDVTSPDRGSQFVIKRDAANLCCRLSISASENSYLISRHSTELQIILGLFIVSISILSWYNKKRKRDKRVLEFFKHVCNELIYRANDPVKSKENYAANNLRDHVMDLMELTDSERRYYASSVWPPVQAMAFHDSRISQRHAKVGNNGSFQIVWSWISPEVGSTKPKAANTPAATKSSRRSTTASKAKASSRSSPQSKKLNFGDNITTLRRPRFRL